MIAAKAIAFFRRDLQVESSYKLAFVFESMASIFPLLTFYFISKLIAPGSSAALGRYGGRYFPFAVVGLAFMQYFMMAMMNFAATIRRAQMAGCLEAMLSTQTQPGTVILLSSVYSFTIKMVHVALILAIGGLLLGADFSRCNVLSVMVIMALAAMSSAGIGILSAAFIVVMKKGDPIEWLIGSVSSLLGGALFPVSIMPPWLQKVSALLPTTYALEALRLAMLKGYSVGMLWNQTAVLGAMAVILLPGSVWVFARAVDKGRRDGTLMHY